MDNKKALKNIALFIGIPVLLMLMAVMVFNHPVEDAHKYSEIVYYFEDQQVRSYNLDLGSGDMTITLSNGSQISYVAPNAELMLRQIEPYVEDYNKAHPNARMTYNWNRPTENTWLSSILPTLILFALTGLFWWWMMKRLNATMGDAGKQMNFGKAKIKQMRRSGRGRRPVLLDFRFRLRRDVRGRGRVPRARPL